MGLFLEAATAWHNMQDIIYILDISQNSKWKQIKLDFLAEDFPHIAGMQYARDVDFSMRPFEYYGKNLISVLLNGKMDDTKIEQGRNWNRICGRLNAIVKLQSILDGDFDIVAFNKEKVPRYSELNALYAIRNPESGEDMYFIFLDERSGRYYCKSAFRKENVDYFKNQTRVTLLQKTKITEGIENVLYVRPGYS